MTRVLVLRNRPSNSALSLARALRCRVNLIRTASLPLPLYGLFVNWGCSTLPVILRPGQVVLNSADAVRTALCKLTALQALKAGGVPVPPFWTRQQKADVNRDGIVVVRHTTRGSGGDGIQIVREGDNLPDAPLYTSYIRKSAEYRVHVFREDVLMVQQKRRENDVEQTADQRLVRNRDNGWIFAANNVTFMDDNHRASICRAAVSAVRALGLDFGAVDIISARRTGEPFVLEVNTAPGIESPTLLPKYVEAINRVAEGVVYVRQAAKVGRARPLEGRQRNRGRGIRR